MAMGEEIFLNSIKLKIQMERVFKKKQRRVCANTISRYMSYCLKFVLFAHSRFCVRNLHGVKVKHVRLFLEDLKVNGLSDRTIYDYARAIRYLFSHIEAKNVSHGSRWDEMKMHLVDYLPEGKRGRPARINGGYTRNAI